MSGVIEALASGASTIARAWIVERADGLRLGFTDHDRDLTVDGTLCRAATGVGAGAIATSSGLSVDNTEVVGALSDDALTEEDIRAGRWDAAEVVAYLVDWNDPACFDILFRGTLGEISEGAGQFTAELRGLAEALNKVRGRVYHSRCDAVLGDARCGIDLTLAGRSEAVQISEVSEEGRVLTVVGAGAYEAHYFARGRILFDDGDATGLSGIIKTDTPVTGGRALELFLPPGALPTSGQDARLVLGCDKLMRTCREKFDNALNFRGFPHIPGDDWLLVSPSAGAQ